MNYNKLNEEDKKLVHFGFKVGLFLGVLVPYLAIFTVKLLGLN